jgi:hypothetical protein
MMHYVMCHTNRQRACVVASSDLPFFLLLLQNRQTPLHRAARQGHTAVVKQLLAAGAAVNIVDKVQILSCSSLGPADYQHPLYIVTTHWHLMCELRQPMLSHTS